MKNNAKRKVNEGKMKIAFLSDSIYPYNKGGKETRSYQLASQLSKKGHQVTFYTMNFWDKDNKIKTKKFNENFQLKAICKNYPLYKDKIRSKKQALAFGAAALKLLKKETDFDVIDVDHMVYFHLWPAKLACKIKNKPLVITWHEVWGKDYWKKYMGKKGILASIIEKKAAKLADKIISISELTTSRLINELNIPKERIITIPNAIDTKEIESINPSKEKSDFIFAGRLNEHKNIDILIRAIALLKKQNKSDKQIQNIKLIIIGDGPEKQNLQNLTSQFNLKNNIIFKGFIEKSEDVIGLIKSSKVFILPSTREGFGISVIEANASGTPVITTDHKDNASKALIKQNKNGITINLSEKDLANAIHKFIKMKKVDYNAMKEQSKEQAKQYDWVNIINMFEKVYEDAVEDGKKER